MFEVSRLEALAFLLPMVGYPVLIIVGLIVETPSWAVNRPRNAGAWQRPCWRSSRWSRRLRCWS
jgi:hypothetical protein